MKGQGSRPRQLAEAMSTQPGTIASGFTLLPVEVWRAYLYIAAAEQRLARATTFWPLADCQAIEADVRRLMGWLVRLAVIAGEAEGDAPECRPRPRRLGRLAAELGPSACQAPRAMTMRSARPCSARLDAQSIMPVRSRLCEHFFCFLPGAALAIRRLPIII